MSKTAVENSLRALRDRSGLSQQALAEHAGVTRQAIIAIEAGRQVPNTALALQLARSLGVRIDDLFRLGDPEAIDVRIAPAGPAAEGATRVALGNVGGAWIAHPLPPDEAMSADGLLVAGASRARPLVDLDLLADRVLVAGCAPLLALLSHRLSGRFRNARMRWLSATSGRALDLLETGAVHIAGLHVSGNDAAAANRDAVTARFGEREMLVVNLTVWRQGLVVPKGNPAGVHHVTDLLRPGLRFVGRDVGAGATQLVARLLRDAGEAAAVRPIGIASGHDEVARYVRYGAADAGVAVEGVALARDLDFVPLTEERFDLVVPVAMAEVAPVRRLFDVLDDPSFREDIGRLPGYDGSLSGHAVQVGA